MKSSGPARDDRRFARRSLPRPFALAIVATGAALLTLVAAELGSRLLDPHHEVLPPEVWRGRPAGTDVFAYTTDPLLGYRPLLGNGDYSEHGTLANEHALDKPPGVTRLFFLGDSVARKATFQKALTTACPDARIEIWTAAVEGYNTVQEVEYYLRYGREVRPDHLTLLFHNNDFLATPVVFSDPEEGLTVFIGETSLSRLDRRLLAVSNLYRHFFKSRWQALMERDLVTTAAETRAAITRLERALEADGVDLTVVLLPILKPLEEWTPRERRRRELGLELLEELGLDYYDLLEPHRAAVAAGVTVAEKPGDHWHPSRQSARRWVRYLLRRGYLGSVVGAGGCRV